ISDRHVSKFGFVSKGVLAFVISMRFNFERIRFDNAGLVRKTGICRIGFLAPGNRMFVSWIIFQPFETVVYEHLGSGGYSVSVLVDQDNFEFRDDKGCTKCYWDTFVTSFAHTGLFWVYTAIACSRLRDSR